jgi:hypothetical protein
VGTEKYFHIFTNSPHLASLCRQFCDCRLTAMELHAKPPETDIETIFSQLSASDQKLLVQKFIETIKAPHSPTSTTTINESTKRALQSPTTPFKGGSRKVWLICYLLTSRLVARLDHLNLMTPK